MKKILYDPATDERFANPVIDRKESMERELPDGKKVPFTYMHGLFEGTNVKFSFCFPEKDVYRGHFFQFLCPFPGPDEEVKALEITGWDDRIAFAVSHGAYYVESNMGSAAAFEQTQDDPRMRYQSSAAVAEFSRKTAEELYGCKRPCGYVYGGSGGGYKAMSCIENTGAWEGAVPYVIGSPMSLPNNVTAGAHTMRVLRHCISRIREAQEPGGDGDIYAGLNPEEQETLREAVRLGIPPRSLIGFDPSEAGALPVLLPGFRMSDPEYFRDFWTKPGYLGTDPDSSVHRDHICYRTKISALTFRGEEWERFCDSDSSTDEAYKKILFGGCVVSEICTERSFEMEDPYLLGLSVKVLSGKAKGAEFPVESIEGNRLIPGAAPGENAPTELLLHLRPGDEIQLDNSDFLAAQTYHRHQVPTPDYCGWNQYRDADGEPIYPQRPQLMGLGFTYAGCGSVQDGKIQGKVIVICCLLDGAFPWQGDWYRRKVASENPGKEKECFRIWYMDNCYHDDRYHTVDETRITSYVGALHQALLELSDWVEKGVDPAESTVYDVVDSQVVIPETADARGGIQPVVELKAARKAEGTDGAKSDWSDCVRVPLGETVSFRARADTPGGHGEIVSLAFSFEGEQGFAQAALQLSGSGTGKEAYAEHTYEKPGDYIAAVRVLSHLTGDPRDILAQPANIARVRVICE